MTRFQCVKLLQASDGRPGSHGSYTWDFQVPTMTGQFWVSLCPMTVHRGLHPFEKRKMARCGWLSGRGGSFFIINSRDGFRFFRA
ncbi:hypothetical protein T01_795 [Trichinella spiralis]|uniref:Uncharacterized protein n=1 Tax=Trichinella spiralis TaxID=6334 RepID=A0A0V1BCF2_TRISP|nr:hypothetical protein T01_795 [Trichinella spiralis]